MTDLLRELTLASRSPLKSLIAKLKNPKSAVVGELMKAARGGHDMWEIRYVTSKYYPCDFTETERKEFYQALESLKITCLSIDYVIDMEDITTNMSNSFIFKFSW